MDISVIIPVYNEENTISDAMEMRIFDTLFH